MGDKSMRSAMTVSRKALASAKGARRVWTINKLSRLETPLLIKSKWTKQKKTRDATSTQITWIIIDGALNTLVAVLNTISEI